jgi:hypothetical protein
LRVSNHDLDELRQLADVVTGGLAAAKLLLAAMSGSSE